MAHAMDLIKKWDRRSSKESAAYTYIYFWGMSYRDLFSEAKFGRFMDYKRKREINIDSPEEQEMALKALDKALIHIEKT